MTLPSRRQLGAAIRTRWFQPASKSTSGNSLLASAHSAAGQLSGSLIGRHGSCRSKNFASATSNRQIAPFEWSTQ